MPRQEPIVRPARTDEWEIVAADSGVADDCAEVVQTGPDLIRTYVEFRVACERIGHGLCQREHDADRWIAATALRLGVPLVSNVTVVVPG